MGRFLSLLLGAAVVFGLAYYTLKGASPLSSKEDPNAQGLQNVRQEAQRIEDDAARRAAEAMDKTAGE